MEFSQLARGKSHDPRLPPRSGKNQHPPIQFARMCLQLALDLSQNATLEQPAALIRLLGLLGKPLGLPRILGDKKLVRRARIVEATQRIEARRHLEGDLAARQCPQIDPGTLTERAQSRTRILPQAAQAVTDESSIDAA